GWERPGLRDWWTDRHSPRLALGILFRRPARFVAGSSVLLATRPARRCGPHGAKITTPEHASLPEPVPHTLLSNQLHRSNIDDFCNRRFGFLGTGISALSPSKPGRRHDGLWFDHCGGRPSLNASWRRHRG